MKRNSLITWCILGVVTFATVAAGDDAAPKVKLTDDKLGEMLQAAVLLARVGMYDEAEERCRQILEQKPDEPTVKQLLQEIHQRRQERDGTSGLRALIQDTIIPEVNFREAAAFEVIESLREQTGKLTRDKKPINLVWQAPEESKSAKITLALRQIPLADVLKYVTESAGLRYRVDAHAVVIYKPLPAAPNVKPQ